MHSDHNKTSEKRDNSHEPVPCENSAQKGTELTSVPVSAQLWFCSSDPFPAKGPEELSGFSFMLTWASCLQIDLCSWTKRNLLAQSLRWCCWKDTQTSLVNGTLELRGHTGTGLLTRGGSGRRRRNVSITTQEPQMVTVKHSSPHFLDPAFDKSRESNVLSPLLSENTPRKPLLSLLKGTCYVAPSSSSVITPHAIDKT